MHDAHEILIANVKTLFDYHKNRAEKGDISSQNKLARLGLAQSTISRMLNRKSSPTLQSIQTVADGFRLEVWQLFIPRFDPANPPVDLLTKQQRNLYAGLRIAALEVAQYQSDEPVE